MRNLSRWKRALLYVGILLLVSLLACIKFRLDDRDPLLIELFLTKFLAQALIGVGVGMLFSACRLRPQMRPLHKCLHLLYAMASVTVLTFLYFQYIGDPYISWPIQWAYQAALSRKYGGLLCLLLIEPSIPCQGLLTRLLAPAIALLEWKFAARPSAISADVQDRTETDQPEGSRLVDMPSEEKKARMEFLREYRGPIALGAVLTTIWSALLFTDLIVNREPGAMGASELVEGLAYCILVAILSASIGTALGSAVFRALTARYRTWISRAIGVLALPLGGLAGIVATLILLGQIPSSLADYYLFIDIRIAFMTGISALLSALIGPRMLET